MECLPIRSPYHHNRATTRYRRYVYHIQAYKCTNTLGGHPQCFGAIQTIPRRNQTAKIIIYFIFIVVTYYIRIFLVETAGGR